MRLGGARYTLVVLTLLNFLNYVDRYVLAAVLPLLKRDPAFAGVTDAQLGALQSSFLLVYLAVSPIAGLAGRRLPRKYLIAIGVGVWSLATAWSGRASGYRDLLVARALIGVGEAAYAALAPAILSDLYASDRRNRILSIFYLATPVGSALGYVVGGRLGELAGWRVAFYAAGAPGLALALLGLLANEPARGGLDEQSSRLPLAEGLRQLMNPIFLHVAAGMTLMTFSIGGLAYWMPSYLHDARGMADGATWFGAISVAAGVIGTVVGGWAGGAWRRRHSGGYLLVSGWGLLGAAPFALAMPFVPGLPLCFAAAFVAELLVFLNTGPLNTELVESSPPSVRELGIGLNVLCIHLLGDALSPPLLGAISDRLVHRGLTPGASMSWAIAVTALPLVAGGGVLLRAASLRTGAAAADALR